MSNQVIQLNTNEMKKVFSHYETVKITRNAPGVVFAAKLPDTSITAYKSGKVLFQGGGAEREAARWGTAATTHYERLPVKRRHASWKFCCDCLFSVLMKQAPAISLGPLQWQPFTYRQIKSNSFGNLA